jgi:hypothetical protein
MSGSTTESEFSSIFATFLVSLSSVNRTWYTLKPIADDVPSIPELLGMSYEQTMYFFRVCGFFDPPGKKIMTDKLNQFIRLHSLEGIIEHSTVKLKSSDSGAKEQHHVFCIGDRTKFKNVINKPGRPPDSKVGRRIGQLQILQKKLQDSMILVLRKILIPDSASLLSSFVNKTDVSDHGILGKFAISFVTKEHEQGKVMARQHEDEKEEERNRRGG